jgi:hypothetical protein
MLPVDKAVDSFISALFGIDQVFLARNHSVFKVDNQPTLEFCVYLPDIEQSDTFITPRISEWYDFSDEAFPTGLKFKDIKNVKFRQWLANELDGLGLSVYLTEHPRLVGELETIKIQIGNNLFISFMFNWRVFTKERHTNQMICDLLNSNPDLEMFCNRIRENTDISYGALYDVLRDMVISK